MTDNRDAIAIVGLGCRLPGGVDSPQTYWDLLTSGRDALVDIPESRWQAGRFFDADGTAGTSRVRRGGFLTGPVDEFDAAFFGISPREADHIDPQQRLLLEVSWEAIEDAGTPLERLAGTAVGVFVGGFTLDYSQMQFGDADRSAVAAHTATGTVMTMLSNRISHAFDFVGPSLTVDTACSSSLVAVHLACRSLWAGESTLALAGGVNLMLSPNFTIAASQGGFLSPTSRSRPFTAGADGYVRGEGAAVVVLKRLSDATADGDAVYTVICGTGITQDGRTSGITVPNGASQQRAMRAALSAAAVAPASVRYVEAHGTGTQVGDPIEVNAIGAVYGPDRGPDDRCLIASVKASIGHLEAAAGAAGLVKAALCVWHRQLPAHPPIEAGNPAIDLDALRLTIPTGSTPLAPSDGVVRAAVNSFGFGGTNAHVVIESAPATPRAVPGGGRPAEPVLPVYPLAARATTALPALAGRYLAAAPDAGRAVALGAAATRHRTHHRAARLAVVAGSGELLREAWTHVRDGLPHPAVHHGGPPTDSPLAFVCTGMGPQWWGMGRQLLESSRVFRAAIERCDAALVPFSGASLVDDLRAEEAGSRMSRTAVAQPANFALQVALTDLWESLGIRPDVLIGHSAGEIAAAHLAGCLSFEDAVKVIYHRARLQDLTTGQGRLVAAAISAERAEGLPEVRDGRLAIAAVNGPEAVALVGPVPDLEAVRAALDADGVFCRFVDGHVPYHSPAMDPLRDELFACLGDVTPRAPHRPIYSTVDGARVKGAVHDAGYWWRNVREPVRFADAALAMIDDGITSFVEIGPHPALSRAVLDGLDVRGRRGLAVPTLKRTEPDAETVAHACARLYVAGYDPDLSVLHHPGPYLRLPAYPWQRERFWREAAASRADRLGEQDHSLLGVRRDVPTPTWSRRLDGSRPDYLADHRVMGATVFPGAGYVEMALAAGRTAFGASRFAVADIRFHAAVVFRPGPAYRLDTTLDPATGSVQVHGGYSDTATPVRHMSARLGPAPVRVPRLDLDGIRLRCTEQWDAARCYRAFEALGFEYGPRFRPIERLHLGQREALGRMAEPVLAHNHDTGLVLDPVVLDGCFQMLLPLVRPDTDDEQATLLPIGVDRIVVHGPVDDARWVWATATSGADEELTGDAVLTTEDGRAVVEVRGFRVQLIGADRQHRARQGNRWLYEPVWQPQDEPVAPEPAPVGQGCWLVLGDRAGLGTAIAERLAHLGHRTVLAQIGDGFAMPAPDRYRLRPDRADLETLVREVAARAEGPVLGVVHVWSGDADLAGLDGEEPLRALDPGALTLVHLVQILDAQSLDCPLAVVTTGAQPVAGAPDEAGLAQASVWGLGRVLHHESLALHTRMFDLDPADPRADIPAFVTDLLHGDHDEDQVAWRAGVRHVARLEPARRTGGWLPVTLRPDATYLVTGGLGALGLLFARWLALRGARHIVLVARSVLPDRRSWDGLAPTDPQYATVRAIVAIEKLGATVETAGLDVAHPDALRGLLQARRVAGRPPVRGVLHCAGAVYDQVLVRMTRDQLDDVLRPKVLGGWSLHRATGSEPLDFFVLFSSVASVVPAPGQGNYAAANAFLDALAHHRRAAGMPALSINWGPWDTGMIAKLSLQSLYEQRGLDLIPEDTGIELFEELLGSPEIQQVVVSAHWPTLIANYPIVPRLVEHLGRTGEEPAAGTDAAALAQRLADASEEEHAQIVVDACTEVIAGVLRVRPENLGTDVVLNQIGMDSMIAVEIRIRLDQTFGVAPKVVFLLQGATVATVAQEIQAQLRARQVPDADTSPEALADLLGELDAADAESLLAEIERSAADGAGAP